MAGFEELILQDTPHPDISSYEVWKGPTTLRREYGGLQRDEAERVV